jgi:mannose-6-phosphate isomerase-like protein (cupin superfamily)
MPPGRWVAAHIHHWEEEAWYVLSGALTFRIGGQAIAAHSELVLNANHYCRSPAGRAGRARLVYCKGLEVKSPWRRNRFLKGMSL